MFEIPPVLTRAGVEALVWRVTPYEMPGTTVPPAAPPVTILEEAGRPANTSVMLPDAGGLGTDTDRRRLDLWSDRDGKMPSLGPGDDGDPVTRPAAFSRDCLASVTGGGGGGAYGGNSGSPNAEAPDVTGWSS